MSLLTNNFIFHNFKKKLHTFHILKTNLSLALTSGNLVIQVF